HFGKTGNFRYFGDRQPSLGEKSRRAGARDQRDAVRGERPGESDDPGLIGNGNQGAADRLRSRHHPGGAYTAFEKCSIPQRPWLSAANSAATVVAAMASETALQPFSAAHPQPISTRSAAMTRSTTAAWLRPARTASW